MSHMSIAATAKRSPSSPKLIRFSIVEPTGLRGFTRNDITFSVDQCFEFSYWSIDDPRRRSRYQSQILLGDDGTTVYKISCDGHTVTKSDPEDAWKAIVQVLVDAEKQIQTTESNISRNHLDISGLTIFRKERSPSASPSAWSDAERPPNRSRTSPRRNRGPSAELSQDTINDRGIKIVQKLLKAKNSKIFAEPVDPIRLNIPDYPAIIKNPMDLGTIQKQCERRFYTTVRQLIGDLNLIWNNAELYNPATNIVHQTAARFRIDCNRLISQHFADEYAEVESLLSKRHSSRFRSLGPQLPVRGEKCLLCPTCSVALDLMRGFNFNCSFFEDDSVSQPKCLSCSRKIKSCEDVYYHCTRGCQQQNNVPQHSYWICLNCVVARLPDQENDLKLRAPWISTKNQNSLLLLDRDGAYFHGTLLDGTRQCKVSGLVSGNDISFLQGDNPPQDIDMPQRGHVRNDFLEVSYPNNTSSKYRKICPQCSQCHKVMTFMHRLTVPDLKKGCVICDFCTKKEIQNMNWYYHCDSCSTSYDYCGNCCLKAARDTLMTKKPHPKVESRSSPLQTDTMAEEKSSNGGSPRRTKRARVRPSASTNGNLEDDQPPAKRPRTETSQQANGSSIPPSTNDLLRHENEKLRQEIAQLRRQNEDLQRENEKFKSRWTRVRTVVLEGDRL